MLSNLSPTKLLSPITFRSYGMECSGDEYYYSGQCHKCQRCPPGQELKEDCGYSEGVSAVCGVCDTRWFKEDWGSHPCAFCQNCRRLNRYQIKRCTHTDNAVCGNCLPGFYSKMRLDGLEDLECLPCGPAPFRNVQCSSCISPVGTRQHDSEAASIPMTAVHTVMQEADVDRSGSWLPLENPRTLKTITFNPRPYGCQAHAEFAAGVISQVTESPVLSSSDSNLSSQHVILTLVGGQSTAEPCCAAEQRTGWGLHAPVECTELDLQHLSNTPEFQAFRPSGIIPTNTPLCPGSDSSMPSLLMLWDIEQERGRERGKGDC
ncbi:Tumor necrosis factor receptor superfamily member 27 X-linked ectodysplasin-A2 receptor [Triplophysa tibetana]|uniref:Tumor necrosis factor receptor superfamily member 27 X-linked ectodysplasin-A2 receptor n=1 Tax=Triplophysa tibetana TaxID=1572043 RepID=A0A5A9P839_9TELE|nr:Tumor necrosis factor receptor superfamily member 27 X-linked ectodysplasin-A2 receptor [Triplophysa tibetana]